MPELLFLVPSEELFSEWLPELLELLLKRLLLLWRLSTGRRERLRPSLRLKLMLRLTLGCITLPTDTGLLDTLITLITLLWHTVDIITDTMDSDTLSDITARDPLSLKPRLLPRLTLRLTHGYCMDLATEATMDTDIITLYLTTTLEDVETTLELRYLVHNHTSGGMQDTFYFRPELSFCSQSYSQ